MMDKKVFAAGMYKLMILANAPNLDEDKSILRTYYEVVAPRVSEEEWVFVVDRVLATERFFPPPAVLLEHAPQFDQKLEAARAFERIWGLREYVGASAPCWSNERVRRELGEVALVAFLRCGGNGAFQRIARDDKSEPFVQMAFVDAYVETITNENLAELKEAKTPISLPDGLSVDGVVKSMGDPK